jgi:diguanylate cyclase (GGDEF)-like protein/hemerythrin-like metal-binding protein
MSDSSVTAFTWDKHFVTGIAEVDEQHHGLVDLINAFGERVAAGDTSAAETTDTLSRLRQYARYHFREEEQLMMTAGIDPRALAAHQQAHQRFFEEIERIDRRLPSLGDTESGQILDYLVHWLGYHILGVDQSMARQLRAIAAGTSSTAAYEEELAFDAGAVQPLLNAISGLLRIVEEKNRELVASNAALETRVAERTRELRQLNDAMHQLAMHDPLTGLPNRRQATGFLDAHWPQRQTEPVSCLMIDADHFKEINDSFGHEQGDRVLKELALEIRQSFRTDDLVCRIGGDEFLVLCPQTPLAKALELAERLRAHINGLKLPAHNGIWQGSLSVGVACATDTMTQTSDLLRMADEGLYAAKTAGRNRACSVQAPQGSKVILE